MDDNERAIKHSDILYDYIKFHLGLYIATPPVLAIVATGLGVEENLSFKIGMVSLLFLYFVAGVHASWTIAGHINTNWTADSNWTTLGDKAESLSRRFFHHYLYWAGLACGLYGMGYQPFTDWQ